MRLVQGGLYRKYYNDALKNSGASEEDSDGFRKLKVTDYLGHTCVLCGGVVISAIVFLCETCVSKKHDKIDSLTYGTTLRSIDDHMLQSYQYSPGFIPCHPTHLDLWKESGGIRYKFT